MRNSNYQNIECLDKRPVVRVQDHYLHALGNSNKQFWQICYIVWVEFQHYGVFRKYDIGEMDSWCLLKYCHSPSDVWWEHKNWPAGFIMEGSRVSTCPSLLRLFILNVILIKAMKQHPVYYVPELNLKYSLIFIVSKHNHLIWFML